MESFSSISGSRICLVQGIIQEQPGKLLGGVERRHTTAICAFLLSSGLWGCRRGSLNSVTESPAAGRGSKKRCASVGDFGMGTCSHICPARGHLPAGLDPGTRRRQPSVFVIPLVAWGLLPSTQKPYCKRIIRSLEQFSCGAFH